MKGIGVADDTGNEIDDRYVIALALFTPAPAFEGGAGPAAGQHDLADALPEDNPSTGCIPARFPLASARP